LRELIKLIRFKKTFMAIQNPILLSVESENDMIVSGLSFFSDILPATSTSRPQIVVPRFPDLKIATRLTTSHFSIIQALYLKGSRERMETESLTDQSSTGQNSTIVTINQWDQEQSFYLNPATKTYRRCPIRNQTKRINCTRPGPDANLSGTDVIVGINSVDTGERKAVGSYTASHIKTTITVKPGHRANTLASVEERDGWYIDLPSLGGYKHIGETLSWLSCSTGLRDRVRFEQNGARECGYPLEEIKCKTQCGINHHDRIELLEFSEVPLDISLFELPADYSPAFHSLNGNYDRSRPDTLYNRAQEYRAKLVSAARRIFR
jgi:hypothetical protein